MEKQWIRRHYLLTLNLYLLQQTCIELFYHLIMLLLAYVDVIICQGWELSGMDEGLWERAGWRRENPYCFGTCNDGPWVSIMGQKSVLYVSEQTRFNLSKQETNEPVYKISWLNNFLWLVITRIYNASQTAKFNPLKWTKFQEIFWGVLDTTTPRHFFNCATGLPQFHNKGNLKIACSASMKSAPPTVISVLN